jgi:hypothetical protein
MLRDKLGELSMCGHVEIVKKVAASAASMLFSY